MPSGRLPTVRTRSRCSAAAGGVAFAQLAAVIGAFAFSTWDGTRVLDSTAARWWMGIVVVLGLAVTAFVVRGSNLALGMLGLAELWVLSWGLAGGLDGVADVLLVATSLVAIAMCVCGARRMTRRGSS